MDENVRQTFITEQPGNEGLTSVSEVSGIQFEQ
jgi:hypothetical protein